MTRQHTVDESGYPALGNMTHRQAVADREGELFEAFVAGIQLVTLGSRGAADEQWVRNSFEEWRNGA